jgi:hypothetical protein
MISILNKFNNRAEIRESKDEILVGRSCGRWRGRAMSASPSPPGPNAARLVQGADRDPVLSYLHITLDRKTGSGALSAAICGVKATLTISAR